MKRELVFTAFNRPWYLNEAIASWNAVRNLKFWNTTFFIEPSIMQDQITDIAMSLGTTVTAIINAEKQGVLVNPWNAINYAFEINGADFVVLAEDDVVVSQDVLEYFEWASEEYATAKGMLCLNAFSQIGGEKANQLTRTGYFSPLVWGIWRSQWEAYLRDTWDKDYSSGNSDGSEAGWDWNINRILQNNNLTVLRPLQSRSDHIGEHNGTHMTPDLFDSSRGVDFEQARGRSRFIEV